MIEKASSNVKDSSLMMTVDDSFRDCLALGLLKYLGGLAVVKSAIGKRSQGSRVC